MPLLPNINVGTTANDGTGDSIRSAFIKVNENFQFIEAFFPNTDVTNLTANISSTGTSTFNNITSNNITNTGNITNTDTAILNNVTVGNITSTVTFTDTITGTDLDLSGAISLTGNITVADTAILNNVTVGNITSAVTFTDTITGTDLDLSGAISLTGNITGANYVVANYIQGDGTGISNITSDLAQYVTQPAQGNITSVGNLTALTVIGNIVSGNLSTATIFSPLAELEEITALNLSATSSATVQALTVSGNTVAQGIITLSSGTAEIVANTSSLLLTNVALNHATTINTASNISNLTINFTNRVSSAYRTANANIATTYANVTTGAAVGVHLKNTSGSTIYVTLPNDNNNLATNLVPINAGVVAYLNFMVYNTDDANVAVAITN